jgi:hypothetical protein
MALKSGYTIGITIFVGANGELGLFENGLRQNVLFLYRLFKASPNCAAVVLLNHGDGEPKEDATHLGIPREAIRRSHELKDKLDFVIVAGAAVDRATVLAWRDAGTKVVSYKGGNGAVISMEAVCAVPPRADAERLFDHDNYDAIWMTPQHIATYRGWCETVYRCPVREVQQIWEPLFVTSQPAEVRQRFGYVPGKDKWRVGIMDPNITVMKTSHLPMMVCETAYRQRRERFAAIYVTNGLAHRENPHFASFAAAMQSARDGIMTLEPRFVGPAFLANHADAVVTHHWENGLNYLFYEILYGGYPLVHNSAFLEPYGYRYADFDAEDGAAKLLGAMDTHDQTLDDYRSRNEQLFAFLSPASAATIRVHEALLAS